MRKQYVSVLSILLVLVLLTACSGPNGGGTPVKDVWYITISNVFGAHVADTIKAKKFAVATVGYASEDERAYILIPLTALYSDKDVMNTGIELNLEVRKEEGVNSVTLAKKMLLSEFVDRIQNIDFPDIAILAKSATYLLHTSTVIDAKITLISPNELTFSVYGNLKTFNVESFLKMVLGDRYKKRALKVKTPDRKTEPNLPNESPLIPTLEYADNLDDVGISVKITFQPIYMEDNEGIVIHLETEKIADENDVNFR